MTTNEKVRTIREWLTSAVTLLIIPMCWLILDHQRLLMEKHVAENYWSQNAHVEWANNHLATQQKDMERVEKQIENNSIETHAISTKLDALIIHVTALQVKMDAMNDTIRFPVTPLQR